MLYGLEMHIIRWTKLMTDVGKTKNTFSKSQKLAENPVYFWFLAKASDCITKIMFQKVIRKGFLPSLVVQFV